MRNGNDSNAWSGPRKARADVVRQFLERSIFSGELRPGTPLDEERIAGQFSISRTPVREALLQLIEAGVVIKASRQRPLVAPLDLRQLIQMCELLSELEGVCAKFAARRVTGTEKEALCAIEQASSKALDKGDVIEYGRQGIRFHVALWHASHNDSLFTTTRSLARRLNPYRIFNLHFKGLPKANIRRLLLSSVLDGNESDAYTRMRNHTTLSVDVLSEYMFSSYRPIFYEGYE